MNPKPLKERISSKATQWQKEHPWWRNYSLARQRCLTGKYKGRRKFKMTMQDFKELWFRDKAWLLKEPSIDRIDNDGDYVKENCRFIEKTLNTALGRPYIKKAIMQFSLDGGFIRCWDGEVDVHNELGIADGNLSSCLHGKRNKCGGYKWKFQEK